MGSGLRRYSAAAKSAHSRRPRRSSRAHDLICEQSPAARIGCSGGLQHLGTQYHPGQERNLRADPVAQDPERGESDDQEFGGRCRGPPGWLAGGPGSRYHRRQRDPPGAHRLGRIKRLGRGRNPAQNTAPTLKNVRVFSNVVSQAGGGIFAVGGSLDLQASQVTNNRASNSVQAMGGGIVAWNTVTTLTSSQVNENSIFAVDTTTGGSVSATGGGIYCRAGL